MYHLGLTYTLQLRSTEQYSNDRLQLPEREQMMLTEETETQQIRLAEGTESAAKSVKFETFMKKAREFLHMSKKNTNFAPQNAVCSRKRRPKSGNK